MRRADAELAFEGVDRPDQPLGDPDGGVGVDQLAAELGRPRPLAALAQDVDEAGDAGNLGAGVAVGAAEVEGGVERLLGLAVVGAVVEDEAEALVELGGDGVRSCSSARASPARTDSRPCSKSPPLASTTPCRPRTRASRSTRSAARASAAASLASSIASRVAGAAAMVVGHRQPLQGGVGGAFGGDEGLGSEAAGGEGLLAFAAEVVDRSQAPLCLGVLEPVAATVGAGGELAPGFRRFAELADQLSAAAVALQRLRPQILGLVFGPELQRLARSPHRVAVGMDRLGACAAAIRASRARASLPAPRQWVAISRLGPPLASSDSASRRWRSRQRIQGTSA